jgi:hypothetical protein
MKKLTACCVFALCAFPAFAATPSAGSNEVRELGHINGVALACRQEATMKHIKDGLDRILPKTADTTYDEIFRAAIQESFIKHQKSKAPCPDEAKVKPGIDKLLAQLRQALGR